MARRYGAAVALASMVSLAGLAHAALGYPGLEPRWVVAEYDVIASAVVALALMSWQLLRRAQGLAAEVDGERRRKAQFESHSRQMYRELERKLEERTAELIGERDIVVRTEKLVSLSRLAGGVAHELNNPLTAILGQAMILRERCEAPELSRGLQVIEEQASRCAGLVRDLVAFASVEQRKVQPLDVHALLEGALSHAATLAPMQAVSVVRQYWPGPLVVTGNMEELEQALTNVIGNAYRAMAAAAGGQLMLCSSRGKGGWIHLEVHDTGVGIDRAVLPYIFDPFYSRPLASAGAGVGLGLSITLGIVEAHGGRIWAESEQGQGTVIFIELPETEPVRASHTEHLTF